MNVGRVTAVYWPGHETSARALAEQANRAAAWPGIPQASTRPIQLVLTITLRQFDSVAQGRAPAWSGGLAFPASNTIVLPVNRGDPRAVLAHELAHLALHEAAPRVPRWFDEGYAGLAAGEWGRLDDLALNWALAMGRAPSLEKLNADLAGDAGEARAAYALATSAVLFLRKLGGERGLSALIAALHESPDFERALRLSLTTNEAGFEELWRRDLRRRYGWFSLAASLGLFWIAVAGTLAVATLWRRRRNRARRLALDEGWTVVEDSENVTETPDARDGPSS